MNQWRTMSVPIPDPGTMWDGKTWVLFTQASAQSYADRMQLVTLMRFHNIVVAPEEGDPVPDKWMVITEPDSAGQEQK